MKLNKTFAIVSLSIGVSLSVGLASASAVNHCTSYKNACNAGNAHACRLYWRSCMRR